MLKFVSNKLDPPKIIVGLQVDCQHHKVIKKHIFETYILKNTYIYILKTIYFIIFCFPKFSDSSLVNL